MRRTFTFLFVVIGSALLPVEAFGQSDTGNGFIPDPDLLIVTGGAFVTDRDGNNEIYAVDLEPDGTGARLTNDAGNDIDPNVGPDGGKIVFSTDRDGNFEIYSMNADGSSPTRLTTDAGVDGLPAWSPTGAQIVFQTDRDGNDEIYVMDFDGMNQTRLTTDAAADQHPRWSPDGTLIVFQSARDGNVEVYTMQPDGTNQTRITNNAASDKEPIWSPDGGRIAFTSDRDGNDEIYSMAADGTAQTRLTNDAGVDQVPSWSPDGTKIAWESDRDGNTNVYIADFDGVNPFPFTTDVGADGAPHWGPWHVVGTSPVGVSVTRNLRIFNPGIGTLDVSTVVSADAQFTLTPTVFSIDGGFGQDVTVTYEPTVAGDSFSSVSIGSNDTKDPALTFLINGFGQSSGGPPIIQSSLAQVTIDTTAVGTSDTAFVAIRNVGSGLLTISDISAAAPFSSFPGGPETVLVGDSLVVGIVFTPVLVGGETGGILITHDDGAAANPFPVLISGFGTGVELLLSQTALDFGDVRVGSQGQQTIALETIGTDSLVIAGSSFSDSAFSASPDSQVISRFPDNEGTIVVNFAPDTIRAFVDTLTIFHSGISSPTLIPVSGQGTPPPAPLATLGDSVITLPDLQVGEIFALVVSLANAGDDTLRVASVSSSHPDVESVTEILAVSPGADGPIEFTVVPSDTGFFQVDLVVVHDAVSSPDTLTIEGIASLRAVTLLPDSLIFGEVEPGFPVTLPFRLANDGPVDFVVSDVLFEGEGFRFEGVPDILPPGSGADVFVTFDPGLPGPATGSLEIVHQDPFVEPLELRFDGLGVDVSFGTVQTELVFVNPGPGGEARDTLIVKNGSTEALTLTPGAASALFRVDPDTLVVPAGGTGTILVVFVSGGTGKFTEELLIAHDAPGRPDLIVPLLVVGGDPDLVLADVEIDFGMVVVADSVTQLTVVENPGSDTLFVSISPLQVNTPFKIEPLEFNVPPGGLFELAVTFNPLHPGSRAESMEIASNADQGGPARPTPSVNLVGTGLGPDVQFGEEILVFGSLEVGVPDTQHVTIRNSGNDTLRIGEVEWVDAAFSVGPIVANLLPRGEQALPIFYLPPDVEPRVDTLWVTTNVLGRERVGILLQALEVPRNLGVSTVALSRIDSLLLPEVGDTVIIDVVVDPSGVTLEGTDLFIGLDPQFLAPMNELTPFERRGATENAIILINTYNPTDGVLTLSTALLSPVTTSGVLVRLTLIVQSTLGDRTAVVVLNEFPARNSQYLSSGSPFTLRPLGDLVFGNQPPRLLIFPLLEAEEDGSASLALNDFVTDLDTPFADLEWVFETGGSLFQADVSLLGDTLIARFFPPPDVFGTFRIGTMVRDPSGGVDSVDAVVKVSPVNDPPIALTDTLRLRGGSRVVVPVLQLVSDIDGDDVHLVSATAAEGAAVVNEDEVIDYTTPNDFQGEDRITFIAADDSGSVVTGTVLVVIAGQNFPPVMSDLPDLEAQPGEMVRVDLANLATDLDDSTGLRWTSEEVTGPAKAVRTIGTMLAVDLVPDAEGSVVILLSVVDPSGASDSGHLIITVLIDRPGDFDRNGEVNLNDFFLFGVAWGSEAGEENYDLIFDVDGDGLVGFFDFLAWVPNFGL